MYVAFCVFTRNCSGDGRLLGQLSSFPVSSSLQSAGVGGTVSRPVPRLGRCLLCPASGGERTEEYDSRGRFTLCERAPAGGGPGGGGGRGMPNTTGGCGLKAERDADALKPIAPVEAALRDAGGRTAGSTRKSSGAPPSNCTVLARKASIAFTGAGGFVFLRLPVTAAISLSAWFLELDRTRLPVGGGGGGKDATEPVRGEMLRCAINEDRGDL